MGSLLAPEGDPCALGWEGTASSRDSDFSLWPSGTRFFSTISWDDIVG